MTLAVTLTVDELEALMERAVRKVTPTVTVDSAPPEVLTREQAAELLQVDPHAIPKLVQEKGLPYARLGKQWRFRRSEVLAWLSAHGEKGAA